MEDSIEHMFDHQSMVGLLPGGRSDPHPNLRNPFDDNDHVYRITCSEMEGDWSEPAHHSLPVGVENAEPSLFTAMVVSAVDREKLNGHDAVRLMQTEARLSSHYEAGKLATMVEVAYSPTSEIDSPPDRDVEVVEYAADEIAAALTLTRRAATTELDLALSLGDRLVSIWERFSHGFLDIRKTRVFNDQLGHLSEETLVQVSDRILQEAPELTTGQLRARLARLVMQVDPQGEDVQYRAGLEDRKVVVYANPDHTATLHASNLTPDRVATVLARINKLAQGLKTNEETRTLDQLRSDVFLDLLEGRHHKGRPTKTGGGVHLTVDLATLTKLSHNPGELGGYGPVIADIARKTAVAQTNTSWDYKVTDKTGRIIVTDITRRRPRTALKREVAAQYSTCVWVGCRMPVHTCDIDHRHPWAQGGTTHTHNLEPLCRHHHMLKHHTPWQLQQLHNGDHKWTSPLNHTYIKQRGPPGDS